MSDDTQVGSIVAYLTLRREDWNAGVRATEQDARRLGTLNPRIRIDANTSEILAQLGLVHAAERKVGSSAAEAKPFVMNLWAALAAVAPAAVPIASVAGGALLGLLPVAATVALGIAGIKNQMKSTALQGTQFANDVNALKGELTTLQTTAASGLMAGIDKAMSTSQPLFAALNADIGETSKQLGGIIGDAAPALLTILHELAPLFASVGAEVAKGAHALEGWAQSSNGISTFVAYVQAELPEVEHLLGGIITLVGHLMQASAGPGGALLHDINLLVGALDAIPVGVLQTAIPLAIALYAALKTSAAVTAAVRGTNLAVASLGNTLGMTGPKAEAAAAAQTAAALQVQAVTAEEAAAVAASQAAMAASAAEAAVEIAAATEGTTSVLAAGASSAAETAIAEAAAFQATAEAAVASAAEISAAAEAAAAASAEAGAAAAVSWSAMLGPLAAVGVGVTLLATLFMNSSSSVDDGTRSVQTFTSALVQAKGAINSSVRGSVAESIVSHKDLLDLQKFGITTQFLVSDITRASTATAPFGDAIERLHKQGKISTDTYNGLVKTMFDLRQGFLASQQAAEAELKAERDQQTAVDGGTAAVRRQASAMHATSTAYLDAQTAAQKNTEQTTAQTLAFQLENNAAGLLNQALQTLAGQNLNVAQAQTALGQSVHSVTDSMHQNGTAIKGSSVAALANQQAIEGNVSAARQLAQAVAQQTGSNEKAGTSYRASKKALEEQLRAHNELTPAVQRYINKLYDTKGISEYLSKHPTKTDLNTGPAEEKVNRIMARIAAIKQGQVPGIDADTDAGKRKIAALQAQIDALHGKTLTINTTVHRSDGTTTNPDKGRARADAAATGTGPGGLRDGWAWVGDPGPHSELVHKRGSQVDVYSHDESMQIAAQMGMNVPTYAAGTTKGSKGPTKSELSAVDSAGDKLASVAADMAASASSVRDAAHQLDAAAKAAGLSHAALAAVAADQRRLVGEAARRDSVRARLGSAPTAPTAYDRLAAAQGQYASDRDKYATALTGFDITGVTPSPSTTTRKVGAATIGTTTPGTLSAASIIAAGGADVANEQEFDKLIHKLVAEGMDPAYVAEIAGKGPTPEALATARALAKSTPAEVRALNRQQGQRKAAGNDLGTFLAKQYDGAGVAAAKSLVAGLKAQEKALTLEMDRIAEHMADTFRKKLGIPTDGGKGHGKGHPVHHHTHVHAAPGHSATTIARLAAAETVWHLKR